MTYDQWSMYNARNELCVHPHPGGMLYMSKLLLNLVEITENLLNISLESTTKNTFYKVSLSSVVCLCSPRKPTHHKCRMNCCWRCYLGTLSQLLQMVIAFVDPVLNGYRQNVLERRGKWIVKATQLNQCFPLGNLFRFESVVAVWALSSHLKLLTPSL